MVAFCRIDVCAYFPYGNQLSVDSYRKTTLVAIYGYLILIVATITSLLIGQDRFSWTQTFAIICICAGVYLVEIAEGKEKKTVKV